MHTNDLNTGNIARIACCWFRYVVGRSAGDVLHITYMYQCLKQEVLVQEDILEDRVWLECHTGLYLENIILKFGKRYLLLVLTLLLSLSSKI